MLISQCWGPQLLVGGEGAVFEQLGVLASQCWFKWVAVGFELLILEKTDVKLLLKVCCSQILLMNSVLVFVANFCVVFEFYLAELPLLIKLWVRHDMRLLKRCALLSDWWNATPLSFLKSPYSPVRNI